MDISAADDHRQSRKLLDSTITTKKIITEATTGTEKSTINATKQLNERNNVIPAPQAVEVLPKVLYLKKLQHPAMQSKSGSIKEPIPKLIVRTKPLKLAGQFPNKPDNNVRFITLPSNANTLDGNDQSPVKQCDAIKSTKIIIKGITSQDNRLMVCESPSNSPTTTEPLVSPHSSPTMQSTPKNAMESNKNESWETVNDESILEMDERIKTPVAEISLPDANVENRPTTNSSTPRTNREMKQLQKTMKESKVLTDYVADVGDATRRFKRKLNESEEREDTAATSLDASQKNQVRSRSLSGTKDSNETESISIRRNTRSLNAEFSAKQRKFLAGIQKHSRDSDEDHSDDERGRGRRKIRKSGKLFPPLKVCEFDLSFYISCVCVVVL